MQRIVKALAAVLGLSVLERPVTALALPGQSIAAFKSWASGKKLLAGIRSQPDEMSGDPAFVLTTADRGIAWRFYATTDGKAIERETIAVSTVGGEPGSAPIRHDGKGYGFTFFASLYGASVAADFRAAHSVGSVKDPTNGQATQYYVGNRYGYTVAKSVTVETLFAVKSDMALAQRCAKAPQNCTE
jgi:hypothetical protein